MVAILNMMSALLAGIITVFILYCLSLPVPPMGLKINYCLKIIITMLYNLFYYLKKCILITWFLPAQLQKTELILLNVCQFNLVND